MMKTDRYKDHSVRRASFGWGLALCALLAAGCDNGSDGLPGSETDVRDTPLCMQEISLETEEEAEQATTRATVTSWSNGDRIGAVAYTTANEFYKDLTICPYTYGSSWGSTTPLYLGMATTDVYLYYPYQTTDTDPRKIGMKITQFSYDDQSNKTLSWGKVTGRSSTNASTGGSAVVLTHAYSKLYLILKGSTGMAGAKVKSITLTGYASGAYLNLLDGTCTLSGSDSFIYEKEITLNTSGQQYLNVLIPPASGLESVTPKLQVDVEGVILTCNMPKITEANKWYSVTATINSREIEVEEVTFEPWTTRKEEVEI